MTRTAPDTAPAVALEVETEHAPWEDLGLARVAGQACSAVARHLGLPPGCEVSLLGADDVRIAALNAEFRGKPRATNVLSWPAQDLAAQEDGGQPHAPQADFPGAPPALGDIALAYETCMAEAQAGGRSPHAHVTHLIVHGMLHLLGYDHERDGDAAVMESLEIAILDEMGIANPYD